MKKIFGIKASGGIAIAKALILQEPELDITNFAVKNVEVELSKVDKAVADTHNEINRIINIAKGKLTDEELVVFEAHKQIASDPFLLGKIKEFIQSNKINAGYAISKFFKEQQFVFEQVDDAYMKERAADIADVAKQMLFSYYNLKAVDLSTIDHEVIIVSDDLTPTQTAQLNKKLTKGFVTNMGGRTSHSAIMARSLEIPAVLGLKNVTSKVKDGELLIIDGNMGVVIVNPSIDEINEYKTKQKSQLVFKKNLKKLIGKKAKTADNIEIELAANIGNTNDLESVIDNDAEGIGLFRSEFLYMKQNEWPSEEFQYLAYKKVLSRMNGKRVIIRTLDIGGDKDLSYFKFPDEMNPFLGYRAIRLTLDKKNVFMTQLKALLRASKYGKLAIMFPMIAVLDEFLEAKKILEEAKRELEHEGKEYSTNVEVGMMIEIPAAALNIDSFALHSDFFSIGTNDLIQYSMAADRMAPSVSYLYRPLNPGILRLIKLTIDGAHKHNKWVGICGEAAANKYMIPILLGMGIDELSMSATSILKTKQIISSINSKTMTSHIDKILQLSSGEEVKSFLQKNCKFDL